MNERSRRLRDHWVPVAALLAVWVSSPALPQSGGPTKVMIFAADMAERGNWREALYRWEQVNRDVPDNPKVLNNLAVAYEVLGRLEESHDFYARAVTRSGGDPEIAENSRRSARFWRQVMDQQDDGEAERSLAVPPPAGRNDSGKQTKGKTIRVPVGLPVPAKLEVEGDETLLVTSFLGLDTNLLDANREMVRFLRGEFRKGTSLDILDVTPPPAIPEQTIPDLLANKQFWQWLHRNHEADLIVSGVITYDREDLSGFREVDVVSDRTGQKVRESRFVEQEQFVYAFDVFFMDGATGTLLYRDRLQRQVVFPGLQNDPIQAFYALSESVADEVLAVIAGRMRRDSRVIFKK